MDPTSTSIVEDTKQTPFCPQTDRRMDAQIDKVKPVYPPFILVEGGGGIIIVACLFPWKTIYGWNSQHVYSLQLCYDFILAYITHILHDYLSMPGACYNCPSARETTPKNVNL